MAAEGPIVDLTLFSIVEPEWWSSQDYESTIMWIIQGTKKFILKLNVRRMLPLSRGCVFFSINVTCVPWQGFTLHTIFSHFHSFTIPFIAALATSTPVLLLVGTTVTLGQTPEEQTQEKGLKEARKVHTWMDNLLSSANAEGLFKWVCL